MMYTKLAKFFFLLATCLFYPSLTLPAATVAQELPTKDCSCFVLGGIAIASTATAAFLFYKLHKKTLTAQNTDIRHAQQLRVLKCSHIAELKALRTQHQKDLNALIDTTKPLNILLIGCASALAYPGHPHLQRSLATKALQLAQTMTTREREPEKAACCALLIPYVASKKGDSLLRGIDDARNDLSL